MTAYFIRRILLIIPTFLGITIMVFIVTRFVPGGPIERIIAESDLEVILEDDEGKPYHAKDGLGNVMYLHRSGEFHCDSVLRVTRANRNPAGPIPVKFANSYFAIKDNPKGPLKII